MAQSKELQELIKSLQSSSYTPMSQEEMQQKAENRYKSLYDQKRLSAQQEYERSAAALDKELAGLGETYDKQREQSAKSYANAYSQTDRNMLSKGMQRSSYGAQTLANIQTEGAEAQQEISDAEAAKRQSIGESQTLLAKQLAEQLKQYDANQAADVLAYLEELEQQEYDREQQAVQYQNQLSMQIYQYLMDEKNAETEQSRWQSEFDLALKQYEDGKKKSSGGSYYNNSTTNNTQNTSAPTDSDLMKDLDALVKKEKPPLPPSSAPTLKGGSAQSKNDIPQKKKPAGYVDLTTF